ncbi:MFS transporter [Chloroflexota bacterium]
MPQRRELLKSPSKRLFYGWVIALCCTIITMINGGCFFTFSVFFKPVALDLGWSRGEFASAYTAMLLAYAPSAFFAGKFADRHGPRGVLLLAGLLIGLGFIGCSRADNLLFMALCYATVGLGLGATLALPTATIQRWFVKWRGLMVGVVVAGIGIGGLLFAPLADYLITCYSWQTAYLLMGAIYGGTIIISALFIVREPKTKKLSPLGNGNQVQDVSSHLSIGTLPTYTIAQAFRLGTFWGLTALHILTFMPTFVINSHLVPYITDQGISATLGAQGLGLISGMSVFGRIILSLLAGKIGWMKTLTVSCFLASISVIWLIMVNEPWMFYIFVVAYGFSWGSILALLGGAVGFFLGMTALSEFLGFMLGIGVLFGSIMPWMGGFLFDLNGNYFTTLVLVVVLFAAAGILSLLFRPKATQPSNLINS